MPSIFKKPRR